MSRSLLQLNFDFAKDTLKRKDNRSRVIVDMLSELSAKIDNNCSVYKRPKIRSIDSMGKNELMIHDEVTGDAVLIQDGKVYHKGVIDGIKSKG